MPDSGISIIENPPVPLMDLEERQSKRLLDQSGFVQLELEGLSAEYAELADTWKVVDTKAQVAATAAGIFLGGIFAVQRAPQLAFLPSEKWLLAIALALLVASVICALRALQLRKVNFPLRGSNAAEIFQDLYKTDEFKVGGSGLLERTIRFKEDQIRDWKKINLTSLAALKSKGAWTMAAQYLFGAGALVFAALSLYEMFRAPVASLRGAL